MYSLHRTTGTTHCEALSSVDSTPHQNSSSVVLTLQHVGYIIIIWYCHYTKWWSITFCFYNFYSVQIHIFNFLFYNIQSPQFCHWVAFTLAQLLHIYIYTFSLCLYPKNIVTFQFTCYLLIHTQLAPFFGKNIWCYHYTPLFSVLSSLQTSWL